MKIWNLYMYFQFHKKPKRTQIMVQRKDRKNARAVYKEQKEHDQDD